MFCKNCGKEIPSGSAFCPNCGSTVKKDGADTATPFDEPPGSRPAAPTQPTAPAASPVPQKKNTMAIVGLVLSFFIPLAGFICSIIGLKKANECNGDGKGLAIAGIVVSVAMWILNMIISAIMYPILMSMIEEILGGVASGYAVIL